MDILYISSILGLLAVLAHIIKGLTGFGPAIVFVSVGSFIYNPIDIIVLAALLDVIGGLYLSLLNPQFLKTNMHYWIPIGSLMILGAIIGSVTLSLFPPSLFEYVLGAAIIAISIWFMIGDFKPQTSTQDSYTISIFGGFVGIFSGFCGGFTGIGGPPLIIYLSSIFKKNLFRAIIVPIFLMAAIARLVSYELSEAVSLDAYYKHTK